MTSRMTLFFEPLDVLQFRDHRPFDMGDHSVARTVFPRPPTFRGALRTLLFLHCKAHFDKGGPHFGIPDEHAWARQWLGGPTDLGTLAIRGPLLARRGAGKRPVEPLFHCPYDVVSTRASNGENSAPELRSLAPRNVPATDGPMRLRWNNRALRPITGRLPWNEGEPDKDGLKNVYLTEEGAKTYIATGSWPRPQGGAEANDFEIPASDLLQHEDRVGIARNTETLVAEDRMFYITSPYRMKAGVGFAIDVALPTKQGDEAKKALEKLRGAVTQLGGKGHRARIEIHEGPLVSESDGLGPANVSVPRKAWLQTPLPLDAPLPPDVLALADRPMPIGGLNFANGAPRALRPALPPGSVLYLPAETQWPFSNEPDPIGYGFALVFSAPSPASSQEGKSR